MIVIPHDLDYRYDRRVDSGFLELFGAGGAFGTLTEYARKARYPVDLQFRRNPKSAAQHASLYVGLSTVLDVHWKPGAVKLAAHRTYRASGFQPAWQSWTAIGDAETQADALGAYLDAVIPEAAAGVPPSRALCRLPSPRSTQPTGSCSTGRVLLHFRDTPTKQRIMDEVTADLLCALKTAPVSGVRPASLGGRCDLLALDSAGRLKR
jgi:hypothetical protein